MEVYYCALLITWGLGIPITTGSNTSLTTNRPPISHLPPDMVHNDTLTGRALEINWEDDESFIDLSQSSNFRADFCYYQPNGDYPDYNSRCKKYFRCEDGQTISSLSCPHGESFSFNEQKCVVDYQMSCVKPVCHQNTNEFFWLPGSLCQSYYYCQHGLAIQFNCPDGKVYSQAHQDCAEGGECFEPLCTGKLDGLHSDTTHECKRLLHCKGGRLTQITSCPPEQKAIGGMCTQFNNQDNCPSPDTTAISVERVNDDCVGYSDGPHVIPATQCSRYQFCKNGKSHHKLTCPKGKKFNGEECLPEAKVTCQDVCHDLHDGYHADKTDGCRKYNLCRGGKLLQRFSCPEGSLFSGFMCLPASLVSCNQPKRDLTNPCTGLPDGFHADYMNGCQKYYYCSSAKVILNATCTDMTIWNGSICGNKELQTCEKPETNKDCHGLATGLYQDMHSNCSKYMFCHEGRKVLLSCPNYHVFNGDKCVLNSTYTCPSLELNSCYTKQDGYHIDEESGCRSYFFCSKGHKSVYICSQNQMFNGTNCVSNTEFTCPYTKSVCQSKNNGYYPDITSNCRKYFFCEAGNRLNTFDCGPRKIFEGSKCVLAEDHECGKGDHNQS